MGDEAKLERRRDLTRMRVQRYRMRKRVGMRAPPRLIPLVTSFTLIASDPPSLLDHPSLRAYRESSESAAKRCAQCNGEPDGKEIQFGNIWLHKECKPFYFGERGQSIDEEEFQRQLELLKRDNAAAYA